MVFTFDHCWLNQGWNSLDEQQSDPDSILNHYKKLISLRRYSEYIEVIVYGDYLLVDENHPDVYAYIRHLEGCKLLVVCNFFGAATRMNLPMLEAKKIVLSNYQDSSMAFEYLKLRAFEAIIYEIE